MRGDRWPTKLLHLLNWSAFDTASLTAASLRMANFSTCVLCTVHIARCAEGLQFRYFPFYSEIFVIQCAVFCTLMHTVHIHYMYQHTNIPSSHEFMCDEPFCEVISVSLHMSVITQDGDSALMIAVRQGKTEVVLLLLKGGTNIHLEDKVNFQCACMRRCGLIVVFCGVKCVYIGAALIMGWHGSNLTWSSCKTPQNSARIPSQSLRSSVLYSVR